MLGMNDGGLPFYSPVPGKWSEPIDVLKKRAIDSYEKNLKALAQHLLDDKIPVIILTPSPYDDTVQAAPVSNVGYNAALVEEAKRAEKVAGELGVPYVDFSSPMNAINQKYQALDPKFSIVGAYRIHPGPEGHLIMAYLFLKAQHVPPDVARFNIKGTDGSVTAATKCTIDQVAKSLPFPVERWYNKPLTWVPFSQDIDSEVFQVTDLPAGNYDIQIDGQTIRSATADELAAGVQMAEETKTPEYQQAYKAWHVYNAVQDDYVKLRDLVCAERTVIDAKIPRPLTLEQENPLIDEYLKTHPDKRAQGQVDIIRNVKPKEADLNAAIDAAITQARTMVVPQPHTVKISTAAAATAAPAGQ
jgi:endoglucanase